MLDELKDKAAEMLNNENLKGVVDKAPEFINSEQGKETIENVKKQVEGFVHDKTGGKGILGFGKD